MVLSEKQYLPTKDDLENEELKSLAKRLKKDTYRETLTNIVEWQERNLSYWFDRADMFILVYVLAAISFYFQPISPIIKCVSSIAFLAVPILVSIIDITFMLLLTTFFSIFVVTIFTILFLYGFPTSNNIFPIHQLIVLSMVTGAMISLWTYLVLRYRRLKHIQPSFRISDVFEMSLPVKKILEYRLAICRDYAKLTSAFLLNICSGNEIYFVRIPWHVAAAIKVNNKIYVLDQRLPITSLEKWLAYWRERFKKRKITATILSISVENGKIETKKIKKVNLQDFEIPNVDTERLSSQLANHIGLKRPRLKQSGRPDLSLPFKNYAIYYENDEITIHSMLKSFKICLEKELCGDLGRISKILIEQREKDLVLNVWTT